jgi:hypothetical protein
VVSFVTELCVGLYARKAPVNGGSVAIHFEVPRQVPRQEGKDEEYD